MSTGTADPRSRRRIDGLAVYDQIGDGTDPPVVIVHGGMDRASSFGRVVRALPDVPVRRYDRRGYGRSEPGIAVDIDRHVADLLAVMGEKPAAVFGHSIGGTIALTAAARHPRRFGCVAVFESPTPWLSTPRDSGSRALHGLAPEDAAERFMIAMAGERIWNRLPPSTREARRREGPALLSDLASTRGEPLFDPERIRIPVIVGAGGASPAHRLTEARDLAAALPDSETVVIDGANHGVHLGDPTATADLIRDLRRRCLGD